MPAPRMGFDPRTHCASVKLMHPAPAAALARALARPLVRGVQSGTTTCSVPARPSAITTTPMLPATLSLVHCLMSGAPDVSPPSAAPPLRRLVLAADVGVNALVLFPVPATDLSLFLGASLPAVQRRRPNHWVAVGGRLTASAFTVLLDSNLEWFRGGVRVHLAVTGAAGRRGRFHYGGEVGPVFGFAPATVAHPTSHSPYGLDLEGRIGLLFAQRTRVAGTFGGTLRFTVPLGDEILPSPVLGLFLGLVLSPGRRR